MAKHLRKPSPQLELRLLQDLNARSTVVETVALTAATQCNQTGRSHQEASERDLSVYREISGNYFSSLREA